MPVIALQAAPDYEIFESGYYEATVIGVTIEDHDPDQYHDKAYKQLRWQWEITIPDRADKPTYSSWTSLSLHEKAKLPTLLRALGIDAPTQLDTDALVGLSCRINIEEKIREDGSTKNHTLGYAPLKKTGQPATAANGSGDGDKPITPTMLAELKRLVGEVKQASPTEDYELPATMTRDEARGHHKALKDVIARLDQVPF